MRQNRLDAHLAVWYRLVPQFPRFLSGKACFSHPPPYFLAHQTSRPDLALALELLAGEWPPLTRFGGGPSTDWHRRGGKVLMLGTLRS